MSHLELVEQSNTNLTAREIVQDLELSVEKKVSDLRVFRIIEKLKSENLLEDEVSRVKSLFNKEIKDLGDDFTEECWQMLTVLELFDEETARHCVDTYLIAKSKVEKELWSGMRLSDEFHKESVSLVQFYRACLLHDLGKVEVPHSVVVNQITDEECAKMLFENKDDVLIPELQKKLGENYSLPQHIKDYKSLLQYLHEELHTRPQTLAPVKLLLEQPITNEVIEQLAHCGCSIEDSLLKIMRTHDEYSKKILQEMGFAIEGELAGAHHKHKADDIKFKITVGTIQITIDLADIVHLADVENAILSKRHYKEGKTPIDALKILSLHSKQGFIESYIAYLWIADEMNKINEGEINEKDLENFNFIAKFLDEEKSHHLAWPDWRINYRELKLAA